VIGWSRIGLGVVAAMAMTGWQSAEGAGVPSIAFYSSDRLPLEALSWHQEVVLDPAKVNASELAALRAAGTLPVAHISGSAVPGSGDTQAARISALLTSLAQKGFSGFLIDARDPSCLAACESLLHQTRRQYPDARIYYWGATSRLPAVSRLISGFVTDSIFTRPSPRAGESTAPVVLDDVEGVRRLTDLVRVRGQFKLPFIVLERMPAGRREQARGIARMLAERGFIPWVTVGGTSLGVGLREFVPRRILILYDSDESPSLAESKAHRHLAMPLEYLGYVVDYLDVRKGTLPQGDLRAHYAGIASWFTDDNLFRPSVLEAWLVAQMNAGLRVAMLGRPGIHASSALLGRMGLVEGRKPVVPPVAVVGTSALTGFEAPAAPRARDLPSWQAREGDVHVEVRDSRGQRITPVVTGSWGGVALDPYVMDLGFQDRARWIIDPFAFFSRALDLEPIPAPDTTTENGRRLLFVHVDGDGFPSRAEMPGRAFAGEVILREFLQRYPLPTTVSIIEGEVGPAGKYPDLAPKLETISKTIFRLPHVEVASHSYSHPFDWVKAAKGGQTIGAGSTSPVHMDIPGYRYSAHREVVGSVQYINQRLAPPDKPARVFLWSGSALPGSDAMREVATLKLANMNGNNAEKPREAHAIAQVPSLGRFVQGKLQAYSQAHNENEYTNDWKGPFYGYREAIGIFKFTESPRRLKPINIYYHFYSGTKPAGLTALHEVYEYAIQQDALPIFVSEMVARIESFHTASFARRIDGAWEARGLGALRTLRLDRRLGWPDLENSAGVAGVADLEPGRYVALSGEGQITLALTPRRPSRPHLLSANAPVVSWKRDRSRVSFRLRGHRPVKMTVGGCTSADGIIGASSVQVDAVRRLVKLSFARRDTGDLVLDCLPAGVAVAQPSTPSAPENE
jgi:hypothetical protein